MLAHHYIFSAYFSTNILDLKEVRDCDIDFRFTLLCIVLLRTLISEKIIIYKILFYAILNDLPVHFLLFLAFNRLDNSSCLEWLSRGGYFPFHQWDARYESSTVQKLLYTTKENP